MKAFSCTLSGCLLALLGLAIPAHADGKVIVHEWGTFTSLQDENGDTIGGINVDDEPAPNFVHFAGGIPVLSSAYFGTFGLPPYDALQEEGGVRPFGSPDVTMRLETPVLYIYPPTGKTLESVPELKVHVDFYGGILGQYYPYARMKGLPSSFPKLTDKTVTSLDWKVLHLGAKQAPITTTDKVWTTPREVSAPLLTVDASTTADAKGVPHHSEIEKFLFYRGLGHLDSPINLADNGRDTDHGRYVNLHQIVEGYWMKQNESKISSSWMVEIRADQSCAFREVGGLENGIADEGIGCMGKIPISFNNGDFSSANLAKLKASMQESLVKEGLYPDEASAMLRTWELSYFKSPGLRFFYIVPRVWVDKVLPLKITGAPTEITRVMIGRIELINDTQHATLGRLASGPCPDLNAFKKTAQVALENSKLSSQDVQAYYRGEKPLSELGVAMPPTIQDYLSLGRFRDALILHEQQTHPSPTLAQFIKDNRLAPLSN